MELGRRRDPLAIVAGVIAVIMALAYVGIMRGQDDQPVWWVLLVLLAATVLAFHAAPYNNSLRALELLVAGVALLGLGFVALFSIGLPILAAGGMCLIAITNTGPKAAESG